MKRQSSSNNKSILHFFKSVPRISQEESPGTTHLANRLLLPQANRSNSKSTYRQQRCRAATHAQHQQHCAARPRAEICSWSGCILWIERLHCRRRTHRRRYRHDIDRDATAHHVADLCKLTRKQASLIEWPRSCSQLRFRFGFLRRAGLQGWQFCAQTAEISNTHRTDNT